MATLGYSANTAIFAKDGSANAAKAYTEINAKKGKNKQSGVSGSKLSLEDGGASKFYTVNTFSSKDHSNGAENVISDVSDNHLSSNRYAVTYAMPKGLVCPDCGSSEHLARDKNDATNRWYCTDCHPDDTVYIGLPDADA
jgi:ribosomal protein S27AE